MQPILVPNFRKLPDGFLGSSSSDDSKINAEKFSAGDTQVYDVTVAVDVNVKQILSVKPRKKKWFIQIMPTNNEIIQCNTNTIIKDVKTLGGLDLFEDMRKKLKLAIQKEAELKKG
eukprot:12410770-Ditylum_brightwellii.AAC.1